MADPVYLRLARNKAIATAIIIGLGFWMPWPHDPAGAWAWLQESSADWKLKFALVGWGVVSLGMVYDTITGFIKAFRMAAPANPRRR
jgi:hypothetical protein